MNHQNTPSLKQRNKRKTVVGSLVALLLFHLVFHVSREQYSAAKVRRLGGSIWYQCGLVHGIHFDSNSKFADADLPILSSFNELTELDLSRTEVTSDGINQLRNCRRLELVELRKDQITDEQEHELMSGRRPIEVAKYTIAPDGMRVGDGYE